MTAGEQQQYNRYGSVTISFHTLDEPHFGDGFTGGYSPICFEEILLADYSRSYLTREHKFTKVLISMDYGIVQIEDKDEVYLIIAQDDTYRNSIEKRLHKFGYICEVVGEMKFIMVHKHKKK